MAKRIASTVKHHFRDYAGSNNDSIDPAEWCSASYNRHPCDDFEPLSDEPNSYRVAALRFLGIMYAIDRYMETAPDARAAVVAVSIALG
jgi:hypothetical protein